MPSFPDSHLFPPARIGIIGGGQLGKMTVQMAKKLGFTAIVLDPYPGAPAAQVADRQIIGGFSDADRLGELIAQCDVTTYDLEHVDVEAVQAFRDAGHRLQPAPEILAIIQDKLRQKERLAQADIPTAPFASMEHPDAAAMAAFGWPLVQKARRGGYDGRGVAVLDGPADLDRMLPVPSLIERRVDIARELGVIVARDVDGHVCAYPVVEMEFDPRANILDLLLAPARIPRAAADRARELAMRTVSVLGGVGVFGVEMFLTHRGEVLINEVAPRPHNSGHYTIEACLTSQYEQHVRAITGLPLGATDLILPAAMINLLGQPGASGPPKIVGLRQALAIPGVSVHIYGKAETRPFRKMGHVTVLDPDLERARAKALEAKSLLRIIAQP